jgi:arsenate reductase
MDVIIGSRESNRMNTKRRVLFISPQNAARSQMMEGYLRAKYGDRYEAFSAGTEPTRINPYAIRVMAEIGIDISRQRSKSLCEINEKEMDVAAMVSPVFSWAKKMIRQWFPDPEVFYGSDEDRLIQFRKLRNDLTNWVDMEFGNHEDS